jgi:DNA-binding transcriptional regulator YiaG
VREAGKYQPLFKYLSECEQTEVTLTLEQIEAIIGYQLPTTAGAERAWWSNRAKGAFQSSAWLEASYRVEQIDLEARTVTFRKPTEHNVTLKDGVVLWDSTLVKALRQHMGLSQADFAKELGIRQQTVSEWEKAVYSPSRASSKHLALIAERMGFKYLPTDE